ncbi:MULTISPECIES: NAD-dependent epimerase/dehydratase family protein [unclassified Sinorhizobium]|uniref:NAD-dependent epimerase/dehydratase family protein n=1 Tax=unclassified Sinorhizobium TaxID=2613772 RepID=UPI003523B01A
MYRYLLVTGGAGFIGSHICRALARVGVVPVVYDNLSTGHPDNVRWGPLVEGDLQDRRRLTTAIRKYRPQGVIHCAASAHVGESSAHPRKYDCSNVGGSLALLETCLGEGLDRFVFSSRCATYGIPAFLPIREEMAHVPIDPYERTKLIFESMLDDYVAAYGLRYVTLRYFNAADADPAEELSEWHDAETHHICDLAQAHVSAIDYLLAGGTSLSLNLGSDQATSVREILGSIRHVTGKVVPLVFEKRRADDPPLHFSDAREARIRLGFAPLFSDIHTIIRMAPSFGFRLSS